MTMGGLRNRRNGLADYTALEPKRLLAGDVRIAAINGAFYVRGDAEPNQIEIVQSLPTDGPRTIRVTGIDGTTVNGREEVLITGAGSNVRQGFRISMGQGDDWISMENTFANGDTKIYGGAGSDSISLYQATLANAVIQTFTGDDQINIDEVIVNEDFRVATQDGDDTVGVSGLRAYGDVKIGTANGNDRVSLKFSALYSEGLDVLTGDGSDFIGTRTISVADDSRIFAGRGNDRVSIFDTKFLSDTVVSGQGGEDQVSVAGRDRSPETLELRLFEGDLEFGNGKANTIFNDLIREGVRLGTIAELANLTPQLSTLSGALEATGLDQQLDALRSTPMTVFAPLDSAFASLPDGLLDGLSTSELNQILRYHVTEGEYFAGELTDDTRLPTFLSGRTIRVHVGDEVVVNDDVSLSVTDIRAKNGIIHLIDEVLIPPAT